jgi:hypothetical protein
VTGFTKADVRATVDGEASDRTVHDVIMTMVDYGLIETVEDSPDAVIWRRTDSAPAIEPSHPRSE